MRSKSTDFVVEPSHIEDERDEVTKFLEELAEIDVIALMETPVDESATESATEEATEIVEDSRESFGSEVSDIPEPAAKQNW